MLLLVANEHVLFHLHAHGGSMEYTAVRLALAGSFSDDRSNVATEDAAHRSADMGR
jgi:hypothetical protein